MAGVAKLGLGRGGKLATLVDVPTMRAIRLLGPGRAPPLSTLAAAPTLRAIRELNPSHVATLTDWFQTLWWSKGRTLDDVQHCVSHSLCVGVEDAESGQLVGFARAISDRTYKALLLDLVVAKERRNELIGAQLVRDIIGQPELSRVRHFELYCAPDMVHYYRAKGFDLCSDGEELCLMRLREASAQYYKTGVSVAKTPRVREPRVREQRYGGEAARRVGPRRTWTDRPSD